MPSTPRARIDDSYLAGKACAICGAPSLTIARIVGLPDHVNCSSCGSVFVVEDGGERVMYGKVPAEFPATRRFALKQWAWLEAVENKSASERTGGQPPSAPTLPSQAQAPSPGTPAAPPAARAPQVQPLPAVFRTRPEPAPSAPSASSPAAEAGKSAKPTATEKAAAKPVQAAAQRQPAEPPAGQRFRVVTTGERVAFPWKVCAHCLRSPTPGRLSIVGVVPAGPGSPRGRAMTFTLPLCNSCQRRARARSDTEKSARLQAVLVSTLVSLLLFVAVLATKVVDFIRSLGLGLLILVVLLAVGYGVVLPLLLSRARRSPPPPDADYVRSTLRVAPGAQGTEVTFDWRNRTYADLFHQANQERSRGSVAPIADPEPAGPPKP